MAALHDMQCNQCGDIRNNVVHFNAGTICPNCNKGRMEILWQTAHQRDAVVHKSERSVVWYSPKEGKHQFPARNDAAIPDRLRKRGYERKELTSLHSVEQFEKQAKVVSHIAWYDRGSGRSIDGD